MNAVQIPAHETNRRLRTRTKIMGIVNVTPDSFSDGGRFFSADDAIRHAYQLLEEGADILDLGAESTRPSFQPVSQEEEWNRLYPVLRELTVHCKVPISVDTYKAKTAAKALNMGVQYINDIWGGLADDEMLSIVADAGCNYIWMHNRKVPAECNPFETLVEETRAGLNRCRENGVTFDKLWIDPGIGFGKTYEHNLTILKRLYEYCNLSVPVLLGTSRKSVIGNTLHTPPDERIEGSLATVVLGVAAGVHCVRVHDVAETIRACKMAEAILDADE